MNTVSDNVWAFAMILIGAVLGVTAAHMGNKDLMALGGTVAGYGAGTFRAKTAEKQ
jgi:hypothetical protein